VKHGAQPATDVNDWDLDQIEQGLKQGDSSTDSFATSSGSGSIIWEYKDNSGWKPFCPAHQSIIEKSHQDFAMKKASSSTVQIKTDEWSYEVDVSNCVQTNLDHPSRRQRDVRRRVL
jgi:hypothetical protein